MNTATDIMIARKRGTNLTSATLTVSMTISAKHIQTHSQYQLPYKWCLLSPDKAQNWLQAYLRKEFADTADEN